MFVYSSIMYVCNKKIFMRNELLLLFDHTNPVSSASAGLFSGLNCLVQQESNFSEVINEAIKSSLINRLSLSALVIFLDQNNICILVMF